MNDELKEVQWIADQYLTHAFHIAAANNCAFKGHLIGLEGDEIVLYIKLQSTDKLYITREKATIKQFKTSCNLEAHLNTILRPMDRDVQPPTHHFVHSCWLTLPIGICLGSHDPYYLDSAPLATHCGVCEGAKPHIYQDPEYNKKP